MLLVSSVSSKNLQTCVQRVIQCLSVGSVNLQLIYSSVLCANFPYFKVSSKLGLNMPCDVCREEISVKHVKKMLNFDRRKLYFAGKKIMPFIRATEYYENLYQTSVIFISCPR